MEDIEHHNIPIYNFPYDPEEDDEETIDENSELRSLLPFALIGCEEEIMVNGRKVRGRQYPWGIVEVDNTQHCDFAKLRFALLRYANCFSYVPSTPSYRTKNNKRQTRTEARKDKGNFRDGEHRKKKDKYANGESD